MIIVRETTNSVILHDVDEVDGNLEAPNAANSVVVLPCGPGHKQSFDEARQRARYIEAWLEHRVMSHSQCCSVLLAADERYCPKCGWEARAQ